jgi:DNA-binding NtrC family response regulator
MSRPSFVLAVVGGPGAGARMILDAAPRIFGRGRTADFVVLDARVSRQHLRIVAVDGGARIEVIDGAAPFLADGVPRQDVLLRVGEAIVVGETVLRLAPGPTEAPDEGASTDVRQLMTGVAADVRGLGAAMELVDSLDAADDEPAIAAALRVWGECHTSATDVTLTLGAPENAPASAAAQERRIVERVDATRPAVVVSAPAHAGGEAAWVTFVFAPSAPITDTTRRLIAVAARLAGSTLARVRSLRRANDDRDLFRRVSLGSARSFLGDSPAAREIAKLTARLAQSDTAVLIEGETGVGKSFLARLLHEASPRAKEPLRIINCAAIPDPLIESELFGHERGAFTGAHASRPGALESAGRGTVVLDEIGELPLAGQAKLLRVLEEKRFERLGSNRSIPLAARVIAATNRDLAADVETGAFRRDLYYRIAVFKLRVPPLRERGEDLVLLAVQILADLAPTAGRRVEGFSPRALDVIRRYSWPGNVRELRNAIERALVVGDGTSIEAGDLPDVLHGGAPVQPEDESLVRLPMRLDDLEERAIGAALNASNGNQRRAAALLGISRVTLHRKLHSKSRTVAQ